MSWLISLIIILSPFTQPKDSIPTDVIILPQSSVKGYFINYAEDKDQIVFFNLQSQDTDYIPLTSIKYFFYNTLPKKNYDTLYLSIKQTIIGKVLNESSKKIIFWNAKDKLIEKYDKNLFLNTKKNAFVKKMNQLFNIYLSLTAFFFIFGLSLILSKDYFSGILYTILVGSGIYFAILIKKITQK